MMMKKKKRMKRDGRRERIGLVRVGTDADEGEEKIKTHAGIRKLQALKA